MSDVWISGSYVGPEVVHILSIYVLDMYDTSDEIDKLDRYGYTSGEPRYSADVPSDFEVELLVMIPVGLFILLVSRILSALSGVDSGSDIATMFSVGAPANFRRSQLAWQMAYCAAFAVAAAIPYGLIATSSPSSKQPLLCGGKPAPLRTRQSWEEPRRVAILM